MMSSLLVFASVYDITLDDVTLDDITFNTITLNAITPFTFTFILLIVYDG